MEYSNTRQEGGSRRFLNDESYNSGKDPLITIITSTFNAGKDLQWTIDSIRLQKYQNIQWIVADGGSNDETVNLLKQNEDIIDYWFSDNDEGIYDAWSKALKYTKGEWVQFIGAGDELANAETLMHVSTFLINAYPNYELVYGCIDIISEIDRVILERVGSSWEEMKNQWHGIRPALPVHPEVFHHIDLLKNLNFTSYEIVGDSFIMLSSIINKPPLFIDVLIDRMPLGGISTNPNNMIKMYLELKLVNEVLSINPPIRNRFSGWLKTYMKYFIKKYLGEKVYFFFADIYRLVNGRQPKWMIK